MPFGPLTCEHCSTTYWVDASRRLKVSRFCSAACRAAGINTPEVIAKKVHRGADHPRFVPIGTRRQWKGVPGIMIKTEKGWEREHRVVMDAPPGVPVHHWDDDPTNNDPENLEIMTQAKHAWIHDPERQRDAKGRFI